MPKQKTNDKKGNVIYKTEPNFEMILLALANIKKKNAAKKKEFIINLEFDPWDIRFIN